MSAPHSHGTGSGNNVKQRIIHPCNFRYAGRLSNDNARFLTAIHEKFALSVTNALELYLGASLRLKLISLEQLALADYIGELRATNYILPCSLNVMDSNCLIDIDIALILPIIDLLLGGAGTPGSESHELTDLDEKIMESVSSLVLKVLEHRWRVLNLTLTPTRIIKPAMVQQLFPANERLVLLRFEMMIGETVNGSFTVAMPAPFVGFLLRHLKTSKSKKLTVLRMGPSLRERMLDCDFTVAAEVLEMRVLLKDMVALRAGAILKTDTPIKKAAKLTIDGVEIFEALPVRNGALKAAQVTCRLQDPTIGKE